MVIGERLGRKLTVIVAATVLVLGTGGEYISKTDKYGGKNKD